MYCSLEVIVSFNNLAFRLDGIIIEYKVFNISKGKGKLSERIGHKAASLSLLAIKGYDCRVAVFTKLVNPLNLYPFFRMGFLMSR